MDRQHEARRLTTILAADVVGYGRLMAADESATLAQLRGALEAHARELELLRALCAPRAPEPCAVCTPRAEGAAVAGVELRGEGPHGELADGVLKDAPAAGVGVGGADEHAIGGDAGLLCGGPARFLPRGDRRHRRRDPVSAHCPRYRAGPCHR